MFDVMEMRNSKDKNSCWEACQVRTRGRVKRPKCQWRSVFRSLAGCFFCLYDCCPLRAILLIISATRIFYYLGYYAWCTSRIQIFYAQYYIDHYLSLERPSNSEESRNLAIFELCWYLLSMGICLAEVVLYIRLFTGTLLIFPKVGWLWFYSCWAVSLCLACLNISVISVFGSRHSTEALWNIVLSTVVVYYEMWLWAFHSKQIHNHHDTYKGIHIFIPETHHTRQSLNPKIFYDVTKRKVPYEVYPGFHDNSYSVAHEYILTHNKFSSPSLLPPRKTLTKQQLRKRMTGLTNQEVDDAVDEFYSVSDPK